MKGSLTSTDFLVLEKGAVPVCREKLSLQLTCICQASWRKRRCSRGQLQERSILPSVSSANRDQVSDRLWHELAERILDLNGRSQTIL